MENTNEKIFSVNELKSYKNINPIAINETDLNNFHHVLSKLISDSKNVMLDLSDIHYITTLFSIEYEKFIAILSLLKRLNNKFENEIEFKRINIKKHFGSFALISFSD